MPFPRWFLTGLVLAGVCSAAPVAIVPPDFRGAVQPQFAVAPGGRIHVAFGKDGAIYHTSSPGGRGVAAWENSAPREPSLLAEILP